jgi:uncharacterized protein
MNDRRRTGPALRRLIVLGGLGMFATGCATGGAALPSRPAPGLLAPGSPLLSPSLPDGEAWLRHYLQAGENESALQLVRNSRARPRDRLLRSLQEGVILHNAGRYAESNRTFEWAEVEADRRYTRSLTRGAGSLVISDRVLAYSPSAGEMAIIPYFRMLNYLALGSLPGAAVEARKANALLARMADPQANPCAGSGMVQYMAGLVLGAAGEPNDALLSLRLAERTLSACAERGGARPPAELGADLLRAALALGVDEVADSTRVRYGIGPDASFGGTGDLVIFLEHGFAVHRVQQDVVIPLFRSEVGGAAGDESSASVLAAAATVTGRIVSSLAGADRDVIWEQPVWSPYANGASAVAGFNSDDVAYLLRLTWPVMRLEASRPRGVRLLVAGEPVDAPALEDLSARMVTDLESRRAAMLARMVTRGVVKYAATRELEEMAEDKGGEALGFLAGRVANLAGAALEQADTRSWSLLPDQISMARIRLPEGEHEVNIEILDSFGGVREIVSLGTVSVRSGERVFLSRRIWGDQPGDRGRLVQLGIDARNAVPLRTSVAGDRRAAPATHRPRSGRRPRPAVPVQPDVGPLPPSIPGGGNVEPPTVVRPQPRPH